MTANKKLENFATVVQKGRRIPRAHHLSGEGLDLADGLGGLLPEGRLVQPLVKVDGVVA